MEVQRYANIVPNGVQHISNVDILVNGETIPANTLIQPLLTNLLKVDINIPNKMFFTVRSAGVVVMYESCILCLCIYGWRCGRNI